MPGGNSSGSIIPFRFVKSCHGIYFGATRNLRAQRMETFTFRVPESLAGRLSSVQMRAWLADFLRQPHILPADPGSGEERVSLTLPSEVVRHAATFLRCSQSVALRRIATERLAICFLLSEGAQKRNREHDKQDARICRKQSFSNFSSLELFRTYSYC